MDSLGELLAELTPEQQELFRLRLQRLSSQEEDEAAAPEIPRRPRDAARLPLSFAQQRLWFLDQLTPGNPVFNVPGAVRLRGLLDETVLARSLNEVVRRHEALRTTFVAEEGEPLQVIAADLALDLPVADLAGHSPEVREAEVRRLAAEEIRAPFDLARGPLVRGKLLRLAAEDHVLLVTMHHIVSDAWSLGLLVREVAILYTAFVDGAAPALPELPIQYADFALWQRDWLRGETLENQLAFWRGQLAGSPPVLELPLDHPRPRFQTSRGARLEFALPADLSSLLKAHGRVAGATPFMTLLAAFATLLHRLTLQDDVPVGSPIANRNRAETEDLIGFFVNLLVLRNRLSGDPTFRELLGRVRETAMAAYAHQDLPFEKLVEDLGAERDPSHSPLFQVAFVLQNAAQPSRFELPGLVLSPFEIEIGTAQFDLMLTLSEDGDRFRGYFEFNRDLFETATIRRWLGHWGTLLEGIAADPDQRLASLPLLSEGERRQLLEWSAARPAGPVFCLHERFQEQAARTPDAAAVSFEGRTLTYRELDRRANQMAHYLRSLGVARGTLVGLCLERSADLAMAVLGILKAGGAYVPLDPVYPPDRLAFALADSGVPVLVAEQALLDRLPADLAARTVLLDAHRDAIGRCSEEAPRSGTEPEDLAYVIYTSGSTGRPKGVQVRHANVARLFTSTEPWFGFGPGDVWTLFHSCAFDFSVWEMWGALLHGGRLVVVPYLTSRSPEAFHELLRREGVTVLNQTPSAFRQLLWAEEALPGGAEGLSLRWVVFGGEALELATLAPWFERHGDQRPRLVNMYGITETTVHVTYRPLETRDLAAGSVIGGAIPDLRLLVLDPRGNPAPIGVPGEIHVGGAGVALGYLGHPGLTAERFVPDPFASLVPGGEPGGRLYRSGDLARRLATGDLEYLGRIDRQVKVRGFRIELGEIEAMLLQHPAVQQAAVVLTGAGRPGGEASLVAYIVSPQETPPSRAELSGFLKAKLPDYMLPASYVALEALPLTPNGKLDVAALPAPDRTRPGLDDREFVAPRNPVEEAVAGIWAEILGLERVGARDNFFELGGHSLLATRLISRLGRAFDTDVPLRSLFDAPSVEGLAAWIAEAQGRGDGAQAPAAALPALQPDRQGRFLPFPLTDVQQAYWIGRSGLFELGNVAAHVYREIEFLDLDLGRLERAFQKVIGRHDMLRAIVLPDGQQQVLEEVPAYRFEVLDLRGQEAEAAAARLEEVRHRMSHQVLATDRWPVFEVRASLLDGRRTRLHVSLDSLILDAWSSGYLGREISRLYDDPEAPLPEIEITFRDYVMAERALRETDLYRRSLDYWRGRLATLPPAPDLPMVKNPAQLEKPRFARRVGRLEPEVWGPLKERGTRSGLTPSGLLLAAFSEVLAAWSKSPRFTLNLTLFNRLPFHPQVNELVGDFTSLSLLEIDNAAPGTFEERARRIQRQLWSDLDHRYVSGVEVQRELIRAQRAASGAVMPIVFTSTLNFTRERAAAVAGSLQAEGVYGISQTSQVLLDHQVVEGDDDSLFFVWDVVEEVFPEGLVLRDMFNAYRDLLRRMAAEEAVWAEARPPLLPAEQTALRAAVNATAAPLPEATLDGLFAAQAARGPERTAVVSSTGTLTYGELAGRANAIARRLRDLGVRPGTLVAVVMEKGWEQMAAVLGVVAAGAAYLPVDSTLPRERLWHLLERGEVRVALTQSWLERGLTWPGEVRCLSVDALDFAAGAPAPEPLHGPESLAYVIFTSGSTGLPKGVMIDHRGAVNTILDLNQRFGVGPDDRVLALSSLSFDLSVYDVFGLLAAGGTVVLPESSAARDPERWLDLMQRERVTLWDSVPALLEMFVEYAHRRVEQVPGDLRLVMLSGDWIPLALPDQIRSLAPGARVIGMGGATEASIWSILYPIGEVDPAWKSIPYGKPMVNQTFHVLDGALEQRPLWVPGDLYIGGAGLALGYWRDEEKTRASFVVHPRTGERLYKTGDLGRYLPDGNIEFLGREDLQVKVQGFRIELGEIETVLAKHPAAAAVAVIAVGERNARRLVGCFVSSRQPAPAAEELRAFLGRELPAYMVPQSFAFLPALPLSANGKVDRRALAEAAPADAPAAPVRAEVTQIAARVAEVVASVLQRERVDPGVNLLELGASSVEVVRIANRLEDEFGFRPRMDDLFRRSLEGAVGHFYEQHLLRGEIYATSPGAPREAEAEDALAAAYPMLRDPEDREAFKSTQPGLRRAPAGAGYVRLDPPVLDDELRSRYLARRSYRGFDERPVSRERFSRFLGSLRQLSWAGKPKYLYGSAGGVYPVQVYLSLKPDRLEGLEAGTYYYDPAQHALLPLTPGARIERGLHAWINQEAFDASAFSIYLIGELRAIAPMYGARSRKYCLLEAGLITQLLETAGPPERIGLCQIGDFDFESVRELFQLGESQVYLHSLVGGSLVDDPTGLARAHDLAEWEEGTL